MDEELISWSAKIVCAYVSNNSVTPAALPDLIVVVASAVDSLANPAPVLPEVEAPKLPPGITLKNSIQPDFLICLEDGKRFKSLKRHLRTRYNLSPDDYRARWALPADYPMVAPTYAAQRSQLAKAMGLGTARTAMTPDPQPTPSPAKANTKRKAA